MNHFSCLRDRISDWILKSIEQFYNPSNSRHKSFQNHSLNYTCVTTIQSLRATLQPCQTHYDGSSPEYESINSQWCTIFEVKLSPMECQSNPRNMERAWRPAWRCDSWMRSPWVHEDRDGDGDYLYYIYYYQSILLLFEKFQ